MFGDRGWVKQWFDLNYATLPLMRQCVNTKPTLISDILLPSRTHITQFDMHSIPFSYLQWSIQSVSHSLTPLHSFTQVTTFGTYCNYILFNPLVSPNHQFVFCVHNPSNNIKQILEHKHTHNEMVTPMKIVWAWSRAHLNIWKLYEFHLAQAIISSGFFIVDSYFKLHM